MPMPERYQTVLSALRASYSDDPVVLTAEQLADADALVVAFVVEHLAVRNRYPGAADKLLAELDS